MIDSPLIDSMLAARATNARLPLGPAPEVGTTVTGVAVLTEREDKTTKHGAPYTRITLRNATGATSLNLWENQQHVVQDLPPGTPVQVALCRVTSRTGEPEWQFRAIERLPDGHPVAREAMPQGRVPRSALATRTTRLLDTLSPDARELFLRVMETPVRTGGGTPFTLKERFYAAPAAVSHHHAHVGGLYHHVVQVAEGALALARSYRETDAPDLDLDAVLLGALLHDSGKVLEYSWTGTIGIAVHAAAMSHMGWGLRLLDEALLKAELTGGWSPTDRQRELVEHVAHIIASHHGRTDWGALAVPASREAQLVHVADLASSMLQPLADAFATQPASPTGWITMQDGWRKRSVFASPTGAKVSGASPSMGTLRVVDLDN